MSCGLSRYYGDNPREGKAVNIPRQFVSAPINGTPYNLV